METVVKWSTRVTVAHLFGGSNPLCLPKERLAGRGMDCECEISQPCTYV